MATRLPSGQGLNRRQYLQKLRGGRSLYGAGSKQVQNIRKTYYAGRGGAPAGPPSPSSPAALPPGQMPWDARYESTRNAVNRNLANTETDFNAAQAGLQREYFDPTNPYNRAQLLKESFENSRRSAQTGYAARGQLYSGSFQRGQDTALRGFQQGQYELQRSFDEQMADLIRRRQQARDEGADTLASAEADRLEAALENRPEDPGAPMPVAATPKKPATKVKKKPTAKVRAPSKKAPKGRTYR